MIANNDVPENISVRPNFLWKNRHETVEQQLEILYDVWKVDQNTGDGFQRLKMLSDSLSWIIEEADKDNKEIRAFGGTWSLSPIAVSEKRMINTRPLNYFFPLSSISISQDYRGDRDKVFFVQCGISIQELNSNLRARNLSLKTSGASNGQTLAGAVSTGTHGSAIDIGSMQDYVVGLYLIVSPEKHILLERESHPVLSQSFADNLDAELIRNDDLFNSAVVSFGSFGIVHALVIETDPIFLLEMHRTIHPVNQVREIMNDLNFSGFPLKHPGERPYHFEIVFNPYKINEGAYVTEMYKRNFTENYTKPIISNGMGPGDDLLSVMGTITDDIPPIIPSTVNLLINQFYGSSSETGTLGEIFFTTTVHGKAASMEIGIPLSFATQTLDIILSVIDNVGPVACIIAFRFVKGSGALLAFTKYDITCTIEIQAVYSQRSLNFYNSLWNKLISEGIPHTFHWGQMNNLDAAKVRTIYGDENVDKWISARKNIVPDRYRKLFNNKILRDCGLDE
jgi:hypothetical protein